ncbi:hypothetical protein G1H11_14120 [Phytoactinopolyspora alkaliphila]|uniref:Uncharacterized protein n=1 Tax=Phytoactinopolyspora alkaliphila TaxID=1783498 RepID=A0A6N9YN90_9ACTN|nr:hypothetical protein [Phytoactinopolyspora alkaliphila]NED96442.1 hypothetical protein [Phytoactinopolyspora alkaliphila]
MTTVWIGPAGAMREVRSPAPMQVSYGRHHHVSRLLSGTHTIQIPPGAPRRWSWEMSWATREELAYLTELEAGLHGGEYYWYDPMALESNMLSAAASMPGTEPQLGWSPIDGASSAVVAAPGVLEVDGTAWSSLVPLLPGRTYTAAVENVDASASVDLMLARLDAAGDVIQVDGPASASAGQRAVLTVTVPESTNGASQQLMLLSPTAPCLVSRPQLTETDSAVDWLPGMGIPRVVVSGVSEIYQMAVAGLPTRSDWSAQLIEVG